MEQEIKYPKIIAGAFIFNEKDQLFLKTSPSQDNKYTCINGKVEWEESLDDTIKRIVKDKTGLKILKIEFIGLTDGLNIKQIDSAKKKHMVFADYKVTVKDSKKLKMKDDREYKWMTIDEWKKVDKSKFGQYIYEIIEKLKEGEEDFKHMYMRALADYQNLLKRTATEKQEFMKFANERLLTEILPVYDNLKMSFKHIGDEAKNNGWLEGIKYVIKQFGDVLKNLGVEEIKTVGEKFDHHSMEAVDKKETNDEKQDGIVESEVMSGYRLGDKVIRAARVVVYEVK